MLVFKRGKFVFLFIVLNIFISYFATTFNEYVVNFNESFFDIFFSILGNVSILLLIAVLGRLVFKSEKRYQVYLLIITFILNTFIFLIIYFTRNYKVMFSLNNLTIFRNPDAGFATTVVLDGIKELFFHFKILLYIPFFILLYSYLKNKKKLDYKNKRRSIRRVSVAILMLLMSFWSINHFSKKLKNDWNYTADIPLYGCQSSGLYNYYFYEVIGLNFNDKIVIDKTEINKYNKNQDYYVNIIDNNVYTNSSNGVLEGMNLFIIQAESLQNFTLTLEYHNEYVMPNLNKILQDENTFYFSNAYSVVGLGNTSDAEFAVLTGYYPTGNTTIAWDAFDNLFDITSLPELFDDSYITNSYNPTIEGFYAHKYNHENLYHFDKFTGLETFKKLYPYENNSDLYYKKMWTTDEAMLNYALEEAINTINNGKHFFSFVETITPHYPFDDLSDKIEGFAYIKNKKLDSKFENYLNQIHYNDKVIVDFINKASSLLPNTVFLIYGDHGNTLDKKDYELLFNASLDELEYRKILLNIPIIFYDPSGLLKDSLNQEELSYMLNRVCSQIDINRTVIDLFNLNDSSNYYGVNLFSLEPSFAIDPKNFDIITDRFIYSMKNDEYKTYDNITYDEMKRIINDISSYKSSNDGYVLSLIKSGEDIWD